MFSWSLCSVGKFAQENILIITDDVKEDQRNNKTQMQMRWIRMYWLNIHHDRLPT